jgi:hypothetical protein
MGSKQIGAEFLSIHTLRVAQRVKLFRAGRFFRRGRSCGRRNESLDSRFQLLETLFAKRRARAEFLTTDYFCPSEPFSVSHLSHSLVLSYSQDLKLSFLRLSDLSSSQTLRALILSGSQTLIRILSPRALF